MLSLALIVILAFASLLLLWRIHKLEHKCRDLNCQCEAFATVANNMHAATTLLLDTMQMATAKMMVLHHALEDADLLNNEQYRQHYNQAMAWLDQKSARINEAKKSRNTM